MNNKMKKLLALVLACAMLIPMAMVNTFALEADSSVSSNWNAMAAKYSKGTWKIIAPKSGNYEIKSEGFTFNETADGGIKVVTPDYATFAGTYGTTAVTSKAATELDGLSVVITPDEYDSMIDTTNTGNSIAVLWTEDYIDSIAQFNDASKAYDKGLYTAVSAYSNGIRHMIPVVDGGVPLTPSYKVSAEEANGQALMVRLTCSKEIGEEAYPIVTSVDIVYYDGYYINDDGHPGYRWTFTAKNHEDTLLGDSSVISRGYESIDLRNGLAINVRADSQHGFIVNINGYDYYKGEEVAFFPDCDTEWVGYKTNELTDEKVENMDPIWTSSMTYARNDIDLTRLNSAGKGYVTVGAVSINDQLLTDHRCNYTIDTINGVPAAKWAGEATPAHECDYEMVATIGATCTRDGYDYYRCTVCGVAKNENVVPAMGHYPKEDLTTLIKPTCDVPGVNVRVCFVCRARLERHVAETLPHTFSKDWEGTFTCTEGGTRTNTCDVCAQVVEETLEPGHVYEWVVTTAPTCAAEGVETETCTACGATGETRPVPAGDGAHTPGAWEPVVVDGAWDGTEVSACTICGEKTDRKVEVFDYIKHFTDVKKGQWYEDEVAYCVQLGYVNGMSDTKFAPNANLTRAQFLTLLAKVDGVDLTAYEGKNAGFTDVKASHWWNEVICWAVENEYTSGVSADRFGPNNNITREQLARFFYVYTEKNGGNVDGRADLSAFEDAGKVSPWATENIKWAVDAGLVTGTTATKLSPRGNATRAQAARMIMLFTQMGECEHAWGEWEVVTAATYETAGLEKRTCSLCEATEERELPILVCEHTWGEWEVVTAATYETAGLEKRTCTTCAAEESREIPVLVCTEHVFGDWTVTVEPTKETEGEQKRACTLCNFEETEVLPVLPSKDFTITCALYPEDLELGAKIDGTDETSISFGINYGDDYNDEIGEFPTASLEGYDFVGWLLEEYSFMMTKEEWDGNHYALTGDCTIYAIFEESAPKMFTLVFDVDGDIATTEDTITTAGFDIGDSYANIIANLPTTEKEGYVFKGWWNRDRRIAITPVTTAEETFDVFIKTNSETGEPEETLEEVEKTIVLVPIWDTEGEKDWSMTFQNWEVEDFEPYTLGINVGDTYMSIFGGYYPDPGPEVLDFDGDIYEFQGWYIEEVNFLLTEGDMWDEGYLALDGHWTFIALYELV